MNVEFDELLYYLNQAGIDSSTAQALSGASLISNIFSIAIGVLSIVALWKMFTKAGEAGWKAIIPFYSEYILFKICWKKRWFWIALILTVVLVVVGGVLIWDVAVYAFGGAQGISEDTFIAVVGVLSLVSVVLSIPLLVINILLCWKIAKSFGKGAGYFFGLLFLGVIFYCIIGFGNAVYVGPNGEGAANVAQQAAQPVAYQPVQAGYQQTAYAPQGYAAYQTQAQGYTQQAAQTYVPQSYTQQGAQTYVPQSYTAQSFDPQTGAPVPAQAYVPAESQAQIPASYIPAQTYTPAGTYDAQTPGGQQ